MRLTGGEIIIDFLVRHRIPYLVGIPGHGCLGLVDALKNYEGRIQLLQVRHEQSAVHLADAYYRLTGIPLAVFTSIGPGAMNTVLTCRWTSSVIAPRSRRRNWTTGGFPVG